MDTITRFTLVCMENGTYDIFLGDDIFVGNEPFIEAALKTIQKSIKNAKSVAMVNVKGSIPTMPKSSEYDKIFIYNEGYVDPDPERPVKICVFNEDGKAYFKVAEHRAARFKISDISDLCARIDKIIEMTGRKVEVGIDCRPISTTGFIPYDEIKKICSILDPYLKRDHKDEIRPYPLRKGTLPSFADLLDIRSKYLDSKKSEKGKDDE